MTGSVLPTGLESIERVTFFKRDELMPDLICCELMARGQIWTLYEEMSVWDDAIAELSALPGFRGDWYARVATLPLAASPFTAFQSG